MQSLRPDPALLDLQRRALVGTLCAGIAHEVEAPLGCAAATLERAAARLRQEAARPDLADELGHALESLHLASEVLREAMRLAGPAEDGSVSDLSRDVAGVLALADGIRPASVTVEPRLAARLPVRASRTHVQQIALNLVTNAFHALAAAGVGGVVRVTAEAGPRGARLVVADGGPGIPEALRGRLFQPFAASRLSGEGPGLGLHVVKRITDMLGGSVDVRSEAGRGTTVLVELPSPPP